MMGTDYYFRVMFSSMKKYIHRLSIRIPNKQFFLKHVRSNYYLTSVYRQKRSKCLIVSLLWLDL